MVGYCFDTSAFIECWTRPYPQDVFPGLWDKLGDLAAHGAIVSPDEVQVEIGRQDDGLKKWTTARPHMFVPLDTEIQKAARDVLAAFRCLSRPSPRVIRPIRS